MPLNFQQKSNSNVVTVKATGTLTDEDYKSFAPKLDAIIEALITHFQTEKLKHEGVAA